MAQCSCGKNSSYEKCCYLYISGKQTAPTAEATMRARYSAFANGELDYLKKTYNPEKLHEYNEEEIKRWALESAWKGLEIVNSEGGSVADENGQVEFVAKYEARGQEYSHHELSTFKKIDGSWFFMDGKIFTESYRRTTPKVGRNDPCFCGSGKKHKKCCMK
ncbi:MAG: hypothetical protein A2504_15170 [Bdellovibrionales bacterium RIFOXYD12_FULL_39_22]|nr:MAG: hypothetical protein A2385_02600 [Bdellovibrionales bacterium RIFOXYB1_FULL_39_21]OFZ43137.1 MAG: hypothetical protein A2485_11745 [Bdellovibrionales bacterium RIFOXYC12_FULL_39_17]OFZ47875.1 MAG: hypothetical protein A2404_16385 [Bdellovibrionales bacterium RIFOXYC1_FULL_39_130]OFZ75655.1 MAG: hypothetical protein A2560_12885 [Bdellovibrionales bacterium RIFOXYD1_FULL_39_84]OFZ94145.1 MAG: hypothetical protein A2504_15170 [Bdellovibrionales bacterium RIFOXYD12_FULL_39_22]HLE11790.1 Yc